MTQQQLCHCGRPVRTDSDTYDLVCDQWPICERRKP